MLYYTTGAPPKEEEKPKEAKKKWSEREAAEQNAKATIAGQKGRTIEVGEAELEGKRVLVLADCEDCRFELPAGAPRGPKIRSGRAPSAWPPAAAW